MTLHQFNRLCEDKQRETLICNGVLLAKRSYAYYTIALFQVEGFYIEVWYTKKGLDIGLVRGFDSTDELQPYLNEISIAQLVN